MLPGLGAILAGLGGIFDVVGKAGEWIKDGRKRKAAEAIAEAVVLKFASVHFPNDKKKKKRIVKLAEQFAREQVYQDKFVLEQWVAGEYDDELLKLA